MTAQLWAGVEAIFDAQHEISFRLPLLPDYRRRDRSPKPVGEGLVPHYGLEFLRDWVSRAEAAGI